MNEQLAPLRLRVDKAKVAELIGVEPSALITLPNLHSDTFTFSYQCHHGSGRQFWLDNGDVNPNWMPAIYIQMNVLFDEDNICYGVAGVCRCGHSYFIAPTVKLLEFLEHEARRAQPSNAKLLAE